MSFQSGDVFATDDRDLDSLSQRSGGGVDLALGRAAPDAAAVGGNERGIDVGRVGSWATDFEKLLSDSVGLQMFTDFLKKEFSAENILFWTSCEKYRKLTSESDRHRAAIEILDRHLSTGAPEPVNVDSHARQAAQDGMADPGPDLFASAQKQIYNLMKFDSFSRFLKSDLYKEALLEEMTGGGLAKRAPEEEEGDVASTTASVSRRTPSNSSHRDKSLGRKSKAETENRRRSLLPWGNLRGKDRAKSKERPSANDNAASSSSSFAGSKKLKKSKSSDGSQLNSSGGDLAPHPEAASDDGCTLARVILPDKATTVVQTGSGPGGETIRALVSRLLEKRGLRYTSFDVFVTDGGERPLDLSEEASTLGCTEVRVEPRVLFR